jgi:polar amino acid transport system substrate-binding protein
MKKLLVPVAASLAILLAATACGSGDYAATEIPAKPEPAPTTPAAPATPKPCRDGKDPLASYAPEGEMPQPGAMPAGTWMAEIQQRGRLIAGVSADSLNLGARDPITGQIQGFDIDMINAVADAIFGPPAPGKPHKVELRVISSPQRIPVLQNGQVDIVARNMTINCSRWEQIAFSAEYYRSGQKTLVPRDSTATKIEDLKGKTICAPAGSTSLDNLKKQSPEAIPVTADTDTGCLALFQAGKAYAITGDDTVLAGDVAQDPYAKVLPQRFSDEPYGLGMSLKHPEFVQFVNQVLAQIKANGTWMGSYARWLQPALGKLSSPPTPIYGRTQGL